jgi:septal ring-binding cell division protein DamX
MRYNAKMRERYDLSLDGKQVCALVAGALVLVAGTFVLGMSLGRQLAPRAEPDAAAPQAQLARLDDPLPLVPNDEPPPVLEAHDALVGRTDEALPTPSIDPPAVQASAPAMPPAADAARAPTAAAVAATSGGAPAPATTATSVTPGSPPALAVSEGAAPTRAASEQARVERGSDQAPGRPKAASDARTGALAKGAYTIQIGSSSRRVDAERLAKRFEARRSRVIAADLPGKGRWYRVQVGSYPTRDAASRQLASFARAGVHGIVTAVR